MKKIALVFALAVFVPSLVLAWLAVRSVRDQQLVAERQQALLYQGWADGLAKDIFNLLTEQRRQFNDQVGAMLRSATPREVAVQFDRRLREQWPAAEVGFVVSLEGQVLAPSLFEGPEARQFRLENDRFLCSRETVEVYWHSPKGPINLTRLDQAKEDEATSAGVTELSLPGTENTIPVKPGKVPRAVLPAKETGPESLLSKMAAEEKRFRNLIGENTEGALARFLQDKLKLLYWYRPPQERELVFGAQVNLARVVAELSSVFRLSPELSLEVCAALLDDMGKPMLLSKPGFKADWRRPFVSTEIGEVLPRWEVGLYLLEPGRLTQSTQTLRLTLGLLIGLLVLAIGVGGWLVVADLRRQLTLARQKTDFVSNVSHELKTPLTSIRMFTELLSEGRVQDEAKRRQYLAIITSEAARLTRLINNVLDFARLERGEKKYQLEPCDLVAWTRETVEAYRAHLETHGFRLQCRWPDQLVLARADRDALSQVLVNLFSNAEKYSGASREIDVALEADAEWVRLHVLDRGLGVPIGCGERVFEQFFRAHDSLSSGIQGSGLGLTLARQIARAHGGDVIYEPREGGGSCFTVKLPRLAPESRAGERPDQREQKP